MYDFAKRFCAWWPWSWGKAQQRLTLGQLLGRPGSNSKAMRKYLAARPDLTRHRLP